MERISEVDMKRNKTLICAGVITMLQAALQGIFSIICLAQYYCILDFLRGYPLLLYIRILYFHNPDLCHHRVNIGSYIPELSNQAFVLVPEIPLTVTRTLIINWLSIVLALLWLFSSMAVMATASKIRVIRWPWIFCTVGICTLDLVATVTFLNDSFYTRTLNDIADYIGGSVSGAGNVVLNTAWASWIMVLLYSRFVVFFSLNVLLVILVIVSRNSRNLGNNVLVKVEQPTQTDVAELTSVKCEDEFTEEIEISSKIPRVGLSKSFRRMKNYLLSKPTIELAERANSSPSLPAETTLRPPSPLRTDFDKKRSVNFPENLLSLPQRLENLIAEQQKRLDQAIIDTAGRQSPTRVSQSLPHLSSTNQDLTQTGDDLLNSRRGRRRSTVAELQGQLPWAYVESSANRMRDQLPPDEDLPPVPLPDYAAIPGFRKASVHRAASSLSSLTQKRDEMKKSCRRKSPLIQSDVLY